MTFRLFSRRLLPCALLSLALAGAGCVPGWPARSRVSGSPASPPASPPAPVIEEAQVEERIQGLQVRLSEPGRDLDPECRGEALALLEDYRRILKEIRSPGGDGRAAAVLFERLGSLQERLLEPARSKPALEESVVRSLVRKWKRIYEAFTSGDHRAVVQTCRDLRDAYGPGALPPDVGVLLALSLAETGDTQEAVRAGERVLEGTQGRPGSVHLRSRMVDWHRTLGNLQQAKVHHEKLVDAVTEERALAQRAERALGISASPPPGEASRRGSWAAPAEAAASPLDDLLHRVEALVQDKEYDKARLLLIRQSIRYPEDPEAAAIRQAMKRVDRIEAEEPEARRAQPEGPAGETDGILEETRRRLAAEDFEGALNVLERLGPEARAEAAGLREQAVSGFIQQERDKAARWFLMARNAREPDEQKAHLQTCHRTLEGLLERFPDAPMAPRIRSNLGTVTEEMERHGISPEQNAP